MLLSLSQPSSSLAPVVTQNILAVSFEILRLTFELQKAEAFFEHRLNNTILFKYLAITLATSSSIAQGVGALAPTYLQTAEAYQEYFSHLKLDGILQINHHFYPRMITTAALAWKNLGRSDFQRHVAVIQRGAGNTQPTLLIKMLPWTSEEIEALTEFLSSPQLSNPKKIKLVENPLSPTESFLSPTFYSGGFPAELAERIPMYVSPRTDDRPYFSFHRKKFKS